MATFALDHLLVYGDVDRVRAQVAATLGVGPDDGGTHPGRGTHNVLYAMVGGRSLELIGPDPAQDIEPFWRPDELTDAPQLWWWAIRAHEPLASLREPLAAAGIQTDEPHAGSRIRPTGDRLTWEMMDLVAHPLVNTVPFVLRWIDGAPPFALNPDPVVRLEDFRLGHPDRDGLVAILAALGVQVPVERTDAPWLAATVASPTGTVRFESR